MNRLLETLFAKHQAWVERQDRVEREHAEWSLETLTAARLRRSRVLLIAGGAVGYRTALNMARLPLGLLTLYPLTEADVEPLTQIVKQPQHTAKEVNRTPSAFRTDNFALFAARYRLVAFAVERPYPEAFESANEACVRVEAAWTNVTMWGAEITLGPTVLPGTTACYHCYLRRRLSNTTRSEVWQAREQFLRNDPSFAFKGRVTPLVNLASAFLTAEVSRFLTGAPAQLALGHEVVYDGLSQTQTRSFVIPLEGCRVCGWLWPQASEADESFVKMVRRAALSSEETAYAGQSSSG